MDPHSKTEMDFYLSLVACNTKIKIKGKGTNPFQIRIFNNLLPKLSQVLKIEGLNAEFRRRHPNGRTRGGHARKRVAIGHAIVAAFPRPLR